MLQTELVYWKILEQAEQGIRNMTQLSLAKDLKCSLSTVNYALKPLVQMGAVRIKQRSFDISDGKKILLYWASIRNVQKDILYQSRSNLTISEIEKNMPGDVLFGAYSAYKFTQKQVPADYSEVYVYSNNISELQKRFPKNTNPPNLFVLKKQVEKMTLTHIFVDLWNLKAWYAKEFLNALEEKVYGLLA